MKSTLLTFIILFFLGCSDQGEVFVQDKTILDAKISCMKLTVFPPNKEIESTLTQLHTFQKECSYDLIVSYKTGITCNSNQNYATKARGMPSSYLRMEIKKDGVLLYTYYKDLKNDLTEDDVKKGFEVISDDLSF